MERIWQKSYAKGVSPNLKFDEISLPEALVRTANRFPDRPALIFQGTVLTFKELNEMVEKFSAGLISLGLRPGMKVGIILPNLVQTAVAIYATLRAGGVVALQNPRGDDLQFEYQFKQANIEIAICLDVLVPRLIELRNKVDLKTIVSCHIRDYLPFLKRQLFPLLKKQLHLKTPAEEGIIEFTELLESSAPMGKMRKPAQDDTAFILFTSATTGKSKGVELTHGNVSNNTQQLRSWFPSFRDGEEVVVGCLPFFHVFGLTCALNIGIFYGYTDILVPVPDPKSILEGISQFKATFFVAVPSFYTGMLNEPGLKKFDLTSLKGCFSGGAPLPLETIKEFEDFTGAQICEGYGLTESSPVTHVNPFKGRTKTGTIGLPLPETDAKIVDVGDYEKTITTPGEPGELCVKGPQIMKRYSNNPQQTAETLKDGWLLTGDIAVMDAEGYFKIVDRKKDIIFASGNVIYPRDVDEVLFQHPKVREACAIGVPSSDGEQCVKAFVTFKEGESAGEPEMIDYCRKHLPPHKVPKTVEFIEELPKSAVGKILRKELRRLHLIHTASRKGKAI
jgi:long-chain acyl-CoA synthetase